MYAFLFIFLLIQLSVYLLSNLLSRILFEPVQNSYLLTKLVFIDLPLYM